MNPPALLVDPGYWLSCDEIAELLGEIEPLTREIVQVAMVDDGPPDYTEPEPPEAEALKKSLAVGREVRRRYNVPGDDPTFIGVAWTDCDGKKQGSEMRLKDGKWYRYTQKQKEVRTTFAEVLPQYRKWLLNTTDPVRVYNPTTGSDMTSPLSGRPLGMIEAMIAGAANGWQAPCGYVDGNGRPYGFPAAWLIFRTALRKKHPMAFYSEREGYRGAA